MLFQKDSLVLLIAFFYVAAEKCPLAAHSVFCGLFLLLTYVCMTYGLITRSLIPGKVPIQNQKGMVNPATGCLFGPVCRTGLDVFGKILTRFSPILLRHVHSVSSATDEGRLY